MDRQANCPDSVTDLPADRAVDLEPVPETMLIPLYGRAVDARSRRPILADPRAAAIVASLDWDFARFDGGPSLFGSVLRTSIVDAWTRRFLAEHPAGTVVEIGAGLNARFERVDNGTVSWFDTDLPDAIAMRRRFFSDNDRRRMLPASVLDPTWVEPVLASPGPHLLIAEAVLGFLPETDVHRALDLVAGAFSGGTLVLDTAGSAMVDNQNTHDALSKVTARLRWACDDPGSLDRHGLRLLESRTLAQPPRPVRRRLSVRQRASLLRASVFQRRLVAGYRLNLLRVERR